MFDPGFYLGEGELTGYKNQSIQKAASKIKGDYLSGIDEYIRSLVKVETDSRYLMSGERSAEKIVEDGFTLGFSDPCHVFLALSRAKGIPAACVETIEIRKGECKIMRPFVDVYMGMDWRPRNPGYGKVPKEGELYILESTALPNMSKRKFVEIARGLDLSELLGINGEKISLRSKSDFDKLFESKGFNEMIVRYSEFTQSLPRE